MAFEPAFENVNTARAAIGGVCADVFKADVAGVRDFCLAATEAMNNAVEHSKTDLIRLELSANGQDAVLKMITRGKRFDPTLNRPLPQPGEKDLPEGGFGLSVIRRLSDGMHYEYRGGKNILTIRKKLGRQSKGG